MKRTQCSGRKANGTQCARSALPDRDLCAQHYGASQPGYVAKPRGARAATEAPSIAMMGTVPVDVALSALAGDPAAMAKAKTFMRPISPEAGHGACDEPPPRFACGDFHDEFTLCHTCDVPAATTSAPSPAPLDQAPQASHPDREDGRAAPEARESTARRVVSSHATLVHCTHQELAAELRARGETVDMLGTDAPYSKETHDGHGTMERLGVSVSPSYDGAERREIDYASWGEAEVREFVSLWHPLTRGWFWSLTDDVLAPVWQRALRDAGRWVAPLVPCTERGMTVKRSGGGPSSCTVFLVVARPRTTEFLRWAVTESHYVVPREPKPIVGGKALELVRQLVVDYSRPGDLVCDPCAGGGGTLRVALRTGRRAIGSEPLASHFDIAASLLAEETAAAALDGLDKAKQAPLFDRDVMKRRRVA